MARPSNNPTACSKSIWNFPGTYLNLGMTKMRITAAASSRTAVTTRPEIRAGFTGRSPNRLIWLDS